MIRDTGEDAFPGDFLHEPKRIQGKTGRRGFHTTHKVKVESCINMKRLIENDKLTINSKACLSEFKNFVSKGNSFSARPGDSDDLVMSMMIAVRVIDYVSTFEDEVYDAVNNSLGVDSLYSTGGDDDDYDDPMPIGII